MMKVILKTYKYRMYPNKEQQQMLAKYFGSVRFVYNHFLAERKQQYTVKNISAGTVDYTDGADVRPFQGQSAMKSEVHKSLVCG